MLVKKEHLQVSPRSRAQERYKILIEPVEADVSGLCANGAGQRRWLCALCVAQAW